jgi:hypothetical protein
MTGGGPYPCLPTPSVYTTGYGQTINTHGRFIAQMQCTSNAVVINPGSISAASWGTKGITLGSAGTQNLTDTTSTTGGGTVPTEGGAALPVYNVNCSAACTITNVPELYLPLPTLGGNVTGTAYSLFAQGAVKIASTLNVTGLITGTAGATVSGAGSTFSGGTFAVNAASANNINLLTGASSGALNLNNGTGSGNTQLGNTASAVTILGNTVSINAAAAGNVNVLTGAGSGALHMNDGTGTGGNFLGNSGTTTTIAGLVNMTGLVNVTTAETGSVCWASSNGRITVDETNTCLVSARKYKTDIEPMNGGLEELLALQPKQFRYRPELVGEMELGDPNFNSQQVGFIADEVLQVDPRLATVEPDGEAHSVRYLQMTALITKALQEEHAQRMADKQSYESREHYQWWAITALTAWCMGLTVAFVIRRKHN